MKTFFAFFTILWGLSGNVLAEETEMNGEALYRLMNQAMVAQDVATLENILDDHFTLTHMTGYVQPKAEWLADISSGRMRYFSTEEVSVDTQNGQTIGRAITKANIWGINGNWRLQQIITVKDGKILQSVASTF